MRFVGVYLFYLIQKSKNQKTQKADVTFLDSTQRKMKMNIPWKALVMVNK